MFRRIWGRLVTGGRRLENFARAGKKADGKNEK